MALPHLVKYIYTHGTDEVIRRGKKIHAIGFVELVEHDQLFGTATFRVPDDSYNTYYKVYIYHFKEPGATTLRCTCPYNLEIFADTKQPPCFSYKNYWIVASCKQDKFYMINDIRWLK